MSNATEVEEGIHASFEEKSAWIQLISLTLVLLAYGSVAGRMMLAGVDHLVPYVPVFAVAVILLVILMVIAYTVTAIHRRPDKGDERDRLIGWRAESRASWILGAGVLLSLGGLVLAVSTVWVAHLLLLSMFLSEMTKLVLQLIDYRRASVGWGS
ncbi:MAG: hypothetical protein AAF514_10680 [Verrucomicrobiota bacterium]